MYAVEIKNLTKKFNDFTAVDKINFTVNEGEIFGFLGPNGAGKTTTISMLSTLLNPSSGEAFVNGFNIKTHKDDVRKSIGIVFQDQSLDEELTAYENMDFHARLYNISKDVRKKKILELLTLVELQERKNDLVKTFSGGMRRRLEIARGLLHEPKVLFLDEPTLGLDPQTRNLIWAYIEKLNKEKKITIILTTHYMEEADKLCQRIAIIDHGKIIVLNTSKNLKESLGGDVITLHTQDYKKMNSLISKFHWYRSSKEHEGYLRINLINAEKHLADIVKLADKNKIEIHSISLNKPTLEDVFLHYTGTSIREEESTPKERMRMRRKVFHH
jgi:ABC-2 type transport system ATP-binding protein